jgi:Na+-transporting methylmalonyl-CoA/oxaloacetate decarboxylase gamma subunit
MLCAQKIQRLMMAVMLSISLMLLMSANLSGIGFVLQIFIIFMIVVWAVTDFCPSIWILEKVIGSCDKKKEED